MLVVFNLVCKKCTKVLRGVQLLVILYVKINPSVSTRFNFEEFYFICF